MKRKLPGPRWGPGSFSLSKKSNRLRHKKCPNSLPVVLASS